MNFRDLYSQLLNTVDPIKLFVSFTHETDRYKPNNHELDKGFVGLTEAIGRNRKGRALTLVRALLLLLGPDKLIKRLKRNKTFRPSYYTFANSTVLFILRDCVEHSKIYGFNSKDANYLSSSLALWRLAPAVKNARLSLLHKIKAKEVTVIKSLLAFIDVHFADGWEEYLSLFRREETAGHSIENLAEAFSYLLRLFHEEISLKDKHLNIVDDNAITDHSYEDLLLDALHICKYLEAEVLIESFPYAAEFHHSLVTVSSSDPLLEKSIQLGYMQFAAQKQVLLRESVKYESEMREKIASVKDLAREFFERLGRDIVKLVPIPVPRYRIEMPDARGLHQLFSEDKIFLEDVSSLETIAREDFVSVPEIINMPIMNNITVFDVIKVQRYFNFLRFGLRQAINNHSPVSDRLPMYLRSCLPVFEHRNLIDILQRIVGEEKAGEMLRLLTCNLSINYIDLQYTPIVIAQKFCILSMSVLCASNLVRNILCNNGKRLTMEGKVFKDPMPQLLKAALEKTGFMVEENIDVGTKSNALEVDVLAYRDGTLFLFECKNPYHPCNVYEMRTTYDHIVHASEQLAERKRWLSNLGHQRNLFEKLSWKADVTDSIYTCIVLGNRVFNGYECNGHPVRQVRELLNILLHGFVSINEVRRKIWQGDKFSVNDLRSYLAETSITSNLMNFMSAIDIVHDFENLQLVFSSFVLDPETVLDFFDLNEFSSELN